MYFAMSRRRWVCMNEKKWVFTGDFRINDKDEYEKNMRKKMEVTKKNSDQILVLELLTKRDDWVIPARWKEEDDYVR